MVKKTIEVTSCSFEVSLAWAISTRNTLDSVYGYSPNQLVFYRNYDLPMILNDKLLELSFSTHEVYKVHTMHAAARKQFITCESSEKLRCSLCH